MSMEDFDVRREKAKDVAASIRSLIVLQMSHLKGMVEVVEVDAGEKRLADAISEALKP